MDEDFSRHPHFRKQDFFIFLFFCLIAFLILMPNIAISSINIFTIIFIALPFC